jgi:hypothetical protein
VVGVCVCCVCVLGAGWVRVLCACVVCVCVVCVCVVFMDST